MPDFHATNCAMYIALIKGYAHIIFFIFAWKQVVGTQEKRGTKALLMSTHSICFHAKIRKISLLF